jgi:hypothetical protein
VKDDQENGEVSLAEAYKAYATCNVCGAFRAGHATQRHPSILLSFYSPSCFRDFVRVDFVDYSTMYGASWIENFS